MKVIILTIVISILIIAGLAWISSISQKNKTNNAVQTNGILTAQEQAYNFGNISMAAGKVSHTFKIKNNGPEPLTITKIYTSCMCTEASFIKGNIRQGAFGMLGMGYIPQINQTLASNEEAQIEAVFDPAAHGPAGLGKMERVVYVENSGKNPKFELFISAYVVP